MDAAGVYVVSSRGERDERDGAGAPRAVRSSLAVDAAVAPAAFS